MRISKKRLMAYNATVAALGGGFAGSLLSHDPYAGLGVLCLVLVFILMTAAHGFNGFVEGMDESKKIFEIVFGRSQP